MTVESNPCNCGTCDKECYYNPDCGSAYRLDKEKGKYVLKDEVVIINKFTFGIGCLTHPQSRAYLMRDVIEELEKRKANCEKVSKELDMSSGSYGQLKGAAIAFGAAIALIKEGVRK